MLCAERPAILPHDLSTGGSGMIANHCHEPAGRLWAYPDKRTAGPVSRSGG